MVTRWHTYSDSVKHFLEVVDDQQGFLNIIENTGDEIKSCQMMHLERVVARDMVIMLEVVKDNLVLL